MRERGKAILDRLLFRKKEEEEEESAGAGSVSWHTTSSSFFRGRESPFRVKDR